MFRRRALYTVLYYRCHRHRSAQGGRPFGDRDRIRGPEWLGRPGQQRVYRPTIAGRRPRLFWHVGGRVPVLLSRSVVGRSLDHRHDRRRASAQQPIEAVGRIRCSALRIQTGVMCVFSSVRSTSTDNNPLPIRRFLFFFFFFLLSDSLRLLLIRPRLYFIIKKFANGKCPMTS